MEGLYDYSVDRFGVELRYVFRALSSLDTRVQGRMDALRHVLLGEVVGKMDHATSWMGLEPWRAVVSLPNASSISTLLSSVHLHIQTKYHAILMSANI